MTRARFRPTEQNAFVPYLYYINLNEVARNCRTGKASLKHILLPINIYVQTKFILSFNHM